MKTQTTKREGKIIDFQRAIKEYSTVFVFRMDDDPDQPLICEFADDHRTQMAWSFFPHLWLRRWLLCEVEGDTVKDICFFDSSSKWPQVTSALAVTGTVERVHVLCLNGSYAYSLTLKGDESIFRAYLCATNISEQAAWVRCRFLKPGRVIRIGTSDGHLIRTLDWD